MGIRVECPHGHVFKVKDKYAGKKGLCPHCEGQVIVQVPDTATGSASDILQREAIQRRQSAHQQAGAQPVSSGSHVFDDPNEGVAPPSSGTSGSLLGSSVIRHNIKCKCGQHVPMWYARCPACGQYLDH
ncbi:MAG TPA: hypothetical protein VFW73_13520 [Lacipirellulaceae bacterium]|nr:hypothetical protein [Lacipirellulaceae bacterium]